MDFDIFKGSGAKKIVCSSILFCGASAPLSNAQCQSCGKTNSSNFLSPPINTFYAERRDVLKRDLPKSADLCHFFIHWGKRELLKWREPQSYNIIKLLTENTNTLSRFYAKLCGVDPNTLWNFCYPT